MDNERFETLIDDFLEGELQENELQEFNSLLELDEDLVREANERLSEHRLLGMIYQPFDGKASTESIMKALVENDSQFANSIFEKAVSSVPEKTNHWLWRLSVLCASILLVVGLTFFQPPKQGGTTTDSVKNIVATLLLSEDCQWNEFSPAEGARLSTGPLELKMGLAVIRFDGGAELVLRDETSLNLLSAGSVFVDKGNVVIRATDEATGFRVQTPATELIDLGTEFSVNVGNEGETKLDVLEGEVSVRPLRIKTKPPRVLTEGNSVLVKDAKSEPQETKHSSERFDSIIKKVQPRNRIDLLFAYEGFFYDEGEVLLKKTKRGKGWSGSWRKRTAAEGYQSSDDTSDVFKIVHGQMNVTWPVPGGRLGMLEIPPGKTYRLREMNRAIDLGKDGIYYFSFMVREPDHSLRDHKTRPRESVRLTFRNEENYFGECLSFGISQGLKPQIRTGQGVGYVASQKAPSNQSTLWIGKIIAREKGDDEIYFRIFGEDDPLNYAEPSQWHVASRNFDLSASLNLVVLTSEGIASRVVDELRIGPTWRSVAPF